MLSPEEEAGIEAALERLCSPGKVIMRRREVVRDEMHSYAAGRVRRAKTLPAVGELSNQAWSIDRWLDEVVKGERLRETRHRFRDRLRGVLEDPRALMRFRRLKGTAGDAAVRAAHRCSSSCSRRATPPRQSRMLRLGRRAGGYTGACAEAVLALQSRQPNRPWVSSRK